MVKLFLKLANMSISAGWLILAVVALRLLLKNVPKYIRCILWGIVGLRLLMPASIESGLSLIPSTQTLPEKILYGPSFDIHSGIAPIDQAVNDYLGSRYFEGITAPAHQGAQTMTSLAVIWVLGLVLMLVYGIVSTRMLRRRVAPALETEKGVWICDYIDTPFVLGILKPRIYLPSDLEEENRSFVLAHERAHLRRKDHWWKPLGFGILSVYWFNPLVWLAYVLLCRDIELACDEKVIKKLDPERKQSYSDALLQCSVPRYMISACPLAFGEVGVRKRIESVLNYKKPAFWLIGLAAAVCLVVAICFLTDPVTEVAQPTVPAQLQQPEAAPPDTSTENWYVDADISGSDYCDGGCHKVYIYVDEEYLVLVANQLEMEQGRILEMEMTFNQTYLKMKDREAFAGIHEGTTLNQVRHIDPDGVYTWVNAGEKYLLRVSYHYDGVNLHMVLYEDSLVTYVVTVPYRFPCCSTWIHDSYAEETQCHHDYDCELRS